MNDRDRLYIKMDCILCHVAFLNETCIQTSDSIWIIHGLGIDQVCMFYDCRYVRDSNRVRDLRCCSTYLQILTFLDDDTTLNTNFVTHGVVAMVLFRL